MTTAYLIHNSEGVPVRRVVETFSETIDDRSKLRCILYTVDEEWSEVDHSKTFTIGDYYSIDETKHHSNIRINLLEQYGYRFEIYWPLTTNI